VGTQLFISPRTAWYVGRFFSIVAEFLNNLAKEEKEEEEKRKGERKSIFLFQLRIYSTHIAKYCK